MNRLLFAVAVVGLWQTTGSAARWEPAPGAPVLAAPTATEHLLITTCNEIETNGRSVYQASLVRDPETSCEALNQGPHASFNCRDHAVRLGGATGTVQVKSESRTALWACVVRDAAALGGRSPVTSLLRGPVQQTSLPLTEGRMVPHYGNNHRTE